MTQQPRQFHGIFDTQYYRIGYWKLIKRERVPRHVVTYSRRLLYRFRMHSHPYAPQLLTELIENDIAGLEAVDTRIPELREDFFDSHYQPGLTIAPTSVEDFGSTPVGIVGELPTKNLDFTTAGGYSVYNWELFYHVPFTIAIQLSKSQRYAEAQRWLHYIFDPTDNGGGDAPQRYWKVRPFQVDEVDQIERILLNLSTGDDPELRDDTIASIGAWRDTPFRPHAIARTRPTAYMYRTVMAYLDNLIAWGDSLFRQDTRESINEAMQLYVLAANILGPRPQAVPKKGDIKRQTYATLADDLDEFGNAARELEAEIPFDLLPTPQPVNGRPEDEPLRSLGRSLYFCVPRNDKLVGYWDTVADRLFNIRNSLNLQGTFRQVPLLEPPIDPAMLARAVAAGVDVGALISGTCAPLAPVRFRVLLQKAFEVCQEVKSLGAQIIAALEKKDNEALAVLRAKHEANLLGLAETVRYGQWQEAIKNREAIERSVDTATERYAYYEQLLGRATDVPQLPVFEPIDGSELAGLKVQTTELAVAPKPVPMEVVDAEGAKLNQREANEFISLKKAQGAQGTATTMEVLASAMNAIPGFGAHFSPFGVGGSISFGGSNIGAIFSSIAAGYRGKSGRASCEATLASKIGSYGRREQEWAQQSNMAAAELGQLYKQLRAAEIREQIAKREYDNHRLQIEQAKDVEDFLTNEKRKKTTEDFYLWMKREAQGLHLQYFQLAYDIAKRAENAFRHELGDDAATFIQTGYLAGREGLFAGERLLLDLKRLEMSYLDRNQRELELIKHVSLREWFPSKLDELRRTGDCSIDLPEQIFDLDCPGHYFRRIKTVAVSIPCVSGPHASVNCRLNLTKSQIRRRPIELGDKWYPDDPAKDERFVNFKGSNDSVVTSSGQNDTGMFETNLQDERYLPFENAGVISSWALKLLGEPRPFDFDTIADVVLSIRYTALAGAPEHAVSNEAKEWLKTNAARLISMRHEFPSEWARFKAADVASGTRAVLAFELTDDHYSFRMKKAVPNAKRLHILGRTQMPLAQVEAAFLRGDPIAPPAAPALLQPIGDTNFRTAEDGTGEGVILPAATASPAGQPPSFDPRGRFELRFNTQAFDDVWLVVDWSTAT